MLMFYQDIICVFHLILIREHFLCIYLCWLLAHCLRGVPCLGPLWASQLWYSCVLRPRRLIIYSLRCRAEGRLCSLLLVFPASLPICLTLIRPHQYKKL